MGYKNTREAGQDLQQKRACQGVENAAEIQGQERHLGRTAKNSQNQWATGKPVAFWYSAYECPDKMLAVRRCYTSPKGGKYMKKDYKSYEICLCNICAGVFFNSPSHRITRADPLQVILDTCDCCRTKRGFDFVLIQLPSTNLSFNHSIAT